MQEGLGLVNGANFSGAYVDFSGANKIDGRRAGLREGRRRIR